MASRSPGRRSVGTRARDADRHDTCQILDTALSEGQLSMTEHRDRVQLATNATTLGDLQDLVADLQTSNASVQLPTLKTPGPAAVQKAGRWGWAAATAAVLVVLGIGIGWGLFGGAGTPLHSLSPGGSEDPGARADGVAPVVLTPPRQLHSLGGLTGLLDQMRQRFGDTMGYRLVVYPEYANLTRPDPAEQRRELNYHYRGGWDDPTAAPKTGDAEPVDLGAFDPATIVGVLRGAPETLGIKADEVSNSYLIIGPGGAADPLSISVYVSSDFGGGYIELAGDGTVKRINYP
ncbi:DUF1707 SHOCT-like domain-containing protein [Mycolicibacterium thermoresistibile]